MFLAKNLKLNLSYTRLISTSNTYNAGHSKWANIRHVKALKDGQKSFLFQKLGRQIRLAIQGNNSIFPSVKKVSNFYEFIEGGSRDPALNSGLKSAVEEALKKNMPNSTIQNILKKPGTEALFKKSFLEIKFLNKIFIICVFYTDNLVGHKMSIASSILKRNSANYSEAKHFFDEHGVVVATDVKEKDEEKIMEDGITAGANDIEFDELEQNRVTFICEPSFLHKVRNNLVKMDYSIYTSEHVFLPKNPISLSESEDLVYQKLIEKLKDYQGMEEIYDNVKVE